MCSRLARGSGCAENHAAGVASTRSSNFDMGHQPVADMNSWFAPTTAGTRANHELTLIINTVPTSVKAPASRKRTRCLVPVAVLAHDGEFEGLKGIW